MQFLVALFVTLALVGVAHAQTPMPVAAMTPALTNLPSIEPRQVQLTPDTVKRFLASLPSMVALARDLDREQGRTQPVRIDESLGILLVPHLFVPEVAKRVNRDLKEFGFENYGDWADVAYSIGLAAEATEFTGTIDFAEQKSGLRHDIETNAGMTAEQKKAALDDLEQKFASLAASEPKPGNREAIAPFLEQLRVIATGG